MNAITKPAARQSLVARMAERFNVEPERMLTALKTTAFKSDKEITNEQMMALLVVADQYGLNPWTKEIFAFPDKGGVVPVVGVDGWSRIINSHDQFDGMEFSQDSESCTCTIYRKDRAHPVSVTEYMAECSRGTAPWKSHPRRMLRHKAMIQCARLAFGYSGIYDQDEAERIVERNVTAESEVIEREPAGTKTSAVKERLRSAATKQEGKPEATPPADAAAGTPQPDPWLADADKKQAELDAEQESGCSPRVWG